ncbi:MAG: NUDIX domain-containing protein [Bacteroidia bacterium]|jgi:8-oxo-dGTP pyrophosphatase MutT (NUDIX family)|nr:NUDIX domain-containing protein [Bacteroidia bacterium]
MYKIFINDKPFILTNTPISNVAYKGCIRVEYDPLKTAQYLKDIDSMKHKGFVLVTDDLDFAFNDLASHMVNLEAAGGLVFNEHQELLMIKRLGKWDLPKGKLDGDESPEQAAIREVEEECNIKDLSVLKQLPSTYHVYKMKNFRFLKTTYWFKMQTHSKQHLKPQVEEQITEVAWKKWNDLAIDSLDTYDSIADLLNEVKLIEIQNN